MRLCRAAPASSRTGPWFRLWWVDGSTRSEAGRLGSSGEGVRGATPLASLWSVQRRWVTSVGVALLTLGLLMLGYVGWQLHGTNYVARQKQAEAVEELEAIWADQPRRDEQARDGGGAGDAATALIRIPKFGRDYVMPVFDGVSDEVLARGFGRFLHAAKPGEPGNYALAAHRVTHGEPLRDMPDLRPGDVIEVETREEVFVYRLDTNPNDLVVTFEETWVVDANPDNPEPAGVEPSRHRRLITLTTCAELFNTDERMITFGHLVQVRRKGAADKT